MKVLCIFEYDVKRFGGGSQSVRDAVMIDVDSSKVIETMWKRIVERGNYPNPVLIRYLPECGRPKFPIVED